MLDKAESYLLRSSKVALDMMLSSPGERRLVGYVAGAAFASLVYVAWLAVERLPGTKPDVGLSLVIAFFFWLASGFALTLLLMIPPWAVAVWAYRRLQCHGELYFALIAAILTFVLGCTTASLAPKPLFIEDQTFLEGAVLAVERQGICFVIAGLVFGSSYWRLGERHIPIRCHKV